MSIKSGTTSLFDRFRKLARELRSANGANVTVTFALATIPMVGFVGAAVDYSHANSVKAAMQAAVGRHRADAVEAGVDPERVGHPDQGQRLLQGAVHPPRSDRRPVNATYTTSGGNKIVVTASANVKANFMGLMGVSQMKVGVESQVKWGNTRLRVALALDTTGSMADDGKIDALKTATKGLLDQLKAAAAKDGDVYVSIIPFSKDVNVGKSNYQATWIDWDEWDDDNGDDVSTTNVHQERQEDEVLDVHHLGSGQPQHLERLRHRSRRHKRPERRRLRHQGHGADDHERQHPVCAGAVRQLLAADQGAQLRLDRR